jgi:hypothetical protein
VFGAISGSAYVDANRNGLKDAGEAGISGVTISLAGQGTTTTAGDGSYGFANLSAGSYTVSAPATAAGKALFTPASQTIGLGAGQTQSGVDFGYVSARIAGVAYKDFNRNGVRDAGEPGLAGVAVVLTGAASGTASTASDGSYSFENLNAGAYAVSAPAAAAGLMRSTPSPVRAMLAAGASRTNLNFGYREAVAPTCTSLIELGPPARFIFTIQDPSGLSAIQIGRLSNVSVVVSPPNTAPMVGPATVTFNPPEIGAVILTATRLNQGQRAAIDFRVRDAFGNTRSCNGTLAAVRPRLAFR